MHNAFAHTLGAKLKLLIGRFQTGLCASPELDLGLFGVARAI